MDISNAGLQLIRNFEGCRLTAYQDVVGNWTIGVGHVGPEVGAGLVWTQEQANDTLRVDVQKAADAVNKVVVVPLTQNQFNALCSLAYNIGCEAFTRSTLVRLLNTGDVSSASLEFIKWDEAEHRIIPDLLRRRQAETALFNTPDGNNG